MLFENFIKNFDEELSKRRGTDQYWTEEELINTFEACLLGLKSLHTNNIIHGNISAKSIVFGVDGFVKIADHFVISDDFKMDYDPKTLNLWAPELQSHNIKDISNDLWQMGLVFLEASILRSSLEVYKQTKRGEYQIDWTVLNKKIQECNSIYGNNLNSII